MLQKISGEWNLESVPEVYDALGVDEMVFGPSDSEHFCLGKLFADCYFRLRENLKPRCNNFHLKKLNFHCLFCADAFILRFDD